MKIAVEQLATKGKNNQEELNKKDGRENVKELNKSDDVIEIIDEIQKDEGRQKVSKSKNVKQKRSPPMPSAPTTVPPSPRRGPQRPSY